MYAYVYLIISALVIAANSWHVITAWLANAPQAYFTGIAHYYADYFLYVAQIAHPGHLFTNEHLAPTWIYWLYNGLGLLHINPFVIYNISIIVFSAMLFWLLRKIVTQVFPGKPVSQIVAFVLITTASNFSGLGEFWFSPTPALNRLGGVPHQIFQTILLLGVIHMSLIRPIRPIRLMFFSFLAATVNPIQMLLICIALLSTRRIQVLFVLIPALIGALLVNAEFTHQPILTAAKVWEDNQLVSVNIFQFFRALGPIGFLLIFGITRYIKNRTPLRIVLGIYGLLSLLVFVSAIPKLLGTTPVRWISPASYLLFPLIAAEGLMIFRSKKILFIVLIIIYGMYTLPSILSQIYARNGAPDALNHVPLTVINRLKHMKGTGVVLTDPSVPYDVIVPVFTGLKTFTGHPIHTLYPGTKEALRRRYFNGEMTETEKQKFLKDHSIGWIITKDSDSVRVTEVK